MHCSYIYEHKDLLMCDLLPNAIEVLIVDFKLNIILIPVLIFQNERSECHLFELLCAGLLVVSR